MWYDQFECCRFIHWAAAPKRAIQQIGWCSPIDPWLTLNTDGSVINPWSKVVAGGLLRNGDGNVIFAFKVNFGRCSITRTELRGAIKGLELAWSFGAHRVILQMDS